MRYGLLLLLLAAPAFADDWPQWLGPRRDGVWREENILDRFPAAGPKLLWRAAVGGGYSGSVVVGDRVIVTDRVLAPGGRNRRAGELLGTGTPAEERVLCFDAKSGKPLWKHEYPCTYEVSYAAGPRATPVISVGKVYALGAMGDLICLDLERGTLVWAKNLPKDYATAVPTWGFAGSPLIDGNRLICLVGGPGSLVVAFEKETGRELWKNLSAGEPGYSPPMLAEVGGARVLLQWHPESINALDPRTGELHWSVPFARAKRKTMKAGMSVASPRVLGDRLFLTAYYEGSLMLRLNGLSPPTQVWRGRSRSEDPDESEAIHGLMATPFLKEGHIYGVCSFGDLRCLNADTGERLWSTYAATGGRPLRWSNAFLIAHEDRFFLFNEAGDLIIAKLSPAGYEEIGRANLLRPTNTMAEPAGRRVIWSHPAFAHRCVFARNDEELVCFSLARD